jgi:hypothetical protein
LNGTNPESAFVDTGKSAITGGVGQLPEKMVSVLAMTIAWLIYISLLRRGGHKMSDRLFEALTLYLVLSILFKD